MGKRTSDRYLAYKITNKINGKAYVGITSQTKRMRWGRHKRSALNEESNTAIARAIRKHGPEAFEMSIVAEAYSFLEACVLERALIASLGTWHGAGGYNLTVGGDGFGLYLGPQRRKQISEKLKADYRSGRRTIDPARQSEATKKAYRDDPSYATRLSQARLGMKFSERHRAKLSIAHAKAWDAPGYREAMTAKVRENAKGNKSRLGQKQSAEEIAKRVASNRAARASKIKHGLSKVEGPTV